MTDARGSETRMQTPGADAGQTTSEPRGATARTGAAGAAAGVADAMRLRVAGWLEPIRADAPAGDDARYAPAHEAVRAEVAKLDSPTGGEVDWERVVERGAAVLQASAKDLRIAGHVAYGLGQRQGLDGLAMGAALLAGLLEDFGEALHPKRPRARKNALAWFVERAEHHLADRCVEATDRPALEALRSAVERLAEVAAARLGDQCPGFRPLREGVQRLELSLPPAAGGASEPVTEPEAVDTDGQAPTGPQQPPGAADPHAAAQDGSRAPAEAQPPRPPDGDAASDPASPPSEPPVPATPAAASVPAVAPPRAGADAPRSEVAAAASGRNELSAFLRKTGTALVETARGSCGAGPMDGTAMRLWMTGLYLPITAPPPTTQGRRTALSAPPAMVREQLRGLAGRQQWSELREQSVEAIEKSRLCLDFHHMLHQALAALDAEHAQALQCHRGELARLLERVPELAEREFSDGTPLADGETREWLAALRGAARPAPRAGAQAGDGDADPLAEARELSSAGRHREAVAAAHRAADAAPSARVRFERRAVVAELCTSAGQLEVAATVFAELLDESDRWGLAQWDPPRVAALLDAYRRCVQAMGAQAPAWAHSSDELHRRLCLVDPAAAMAVS